MPTTPQPSNRRRGPQRIYVLHPYCGQGRPGERQTNKARIGLICRDIVRMGHIPISPIHALSFLDDTVLMDRLDALRLSRTYIEMADTVWAFIIDASSIERKDPYGLRWVQSDGCRADHDAAIQLQRPITYHVYEPLDCEAVPQGV